MRGYPPVRCVVAPGGSGVFYAQGARRMAFAWFIAEIILL